MTEVTIYLGEGTEVKSIWAGKLATVPRVGESIVIGSGPVYNVVTVRHFLPDTEHVGHIKIYVR